jgi:hypothetical protein
MIKQLLLNWKMLLIVAALLVLFSQFHSCRVGKLQKALDSAQTERDAADQDAYQANEFLDSARIKTQRLTGIILTDSTLYAEQILSMQSIISQVRNKANREREMYVTLIEELRKGLPPKECYNFFGRRAPCKD